MTLDFHALPWNLAYSILTRFPWLAMDGSSSRLPSVIWPWGVYQLQQLLHQAGCGLREIDDTFA